MPSLEDFQAATVRVTAKNNPLYNLTGNASEVISAQDNPKGKDAVVVCFTDGAAFSSAFAPADLQLCNGPD
jgi:hypothetical protein